MQELNANEKIASASKYLLQKGAKEVYLFGSRLRGDFSDTSDFDFGVRGFPNEGFYSAIYDLETITDSSVDLVDFDDQTDFFEMLQKVGEVERVG